MIPTSSTSVFRGTQKVLSSRLRRFHFLLLAVSNFIMVWYAFQLWSGYGHRTRSQSYISLSFEATQHIQTKGSTDRIGVASSKRKTFSVKFPGQTSKQIRLKQRIYVYKARPNIFANYIYLIAHEQLRYEDEVSLTQLICDTYRHLLEARQNDNQRTSYGSW